jgi:transcriptional regulator of arginine metabolism
MQKTERHKLILDSISERAISNQHELMDILHSEGVEVTQASVSRDLSELGVVKIGGRYARPELPTPESSPFGIRTIDPSGDSLVVIKCASGLASAVAVRLDGENLSDVVGTIAGDDTIFVAVRDQSSQKAAMKKLRTLFAA